MNDWDKLISDFATECASRGANTAKKVKKYIKDYINARYKGIRKNFVSLQPKNHK